MDKKSLSERDICTKFVTPAIVRAGWDLETQVREQVYLTKGRVIVRGKLVTRGERKFADYVLYWKPRHPIAIIEAKDNHHAVGDGMQQALGYAEMMQDVPFVFSSNGDGFLFHDRTGMSEKVERHLSLDQLPSPAELWERYRAWKKITPEVEAVLSQSYHSDGSGKEPRYYQQLAINRVVEAVARGDDRILLVMATGTGKTYTAFQIIWRLWKAKAKRRILFLADRDILISQTMTNDFKPFGGAMTRIKDRKVDKSYEIYLALYQAITGSEPKDDLFRQFSPDFFDLIVVDECHRGSAADDSAWRDVLEYFSSATQLGLTATPKETCDVSTQTYFGDPVYTYSLASGIDDGFLAPYKVVRIDTNVDVTGFEPTKGQRDEHGREIDPGIYDRNQFDRKIILEPRTELVAKKVTEFLKATNRYDKTIVFCEDIEHAERMRVALVNENADLCAANRKYVMRITGDSPAGKAELDNFIHPEERYPVIVTTSKLMSTGVDARTCKVIVLDQTIRSMTEFKQIIGRGTRIEEDYGKLFFTILDFKNATRLFADRDFDGDPVVVYQPAPDGPVAPPDDAPPDDDTAGGVLATGTLSGGGPDDTGETDDEDGSDPGGAAGTGSAALPKKYVIKDVTVLVASERVQYRGKDGKLITESLRDYSRKAILETYGSLDAFLKTWSEAEKKQAIVKALYEQGVFFDELAEEVANARGGLAAELSAFDLICHVAFDTPPKTRKERAKKVREATYFDKFGAAARAVLEALLDKFENEGVDDIENVRVLQVQPISKLGTPVELLQRFGGREPYQEAVRGLEDELYDTEPGPKSA